MKKKIAILGSTGSIGKTLIEIIKKNPKKFDLILLTANKNFKELFKQAKSLKVKNLIINDKKGYEFLKKNKLKSTKVFNDYKILDKIIKKKIDYTMCSITGLAGLEPTLKMVKKTNVIAIANKETIICAWNLISSELKKKQYKVYSCRLRALFYLVFNQRV